MRKSNIAAYEIEEQIGSGGMGIIYKVHRTDNHSRIYALKVMKEEFKYDEDHKQQFINESQLIASFDHPNITKIYERGEDDGLLYIVMELLEGMTLADRYVTHDYLPIPQALHIMMQVSHLLLTIHKRDIIHRDLKPKNIMLVKQENDPNFVKLLDFGIAGEIHIPHLTETGQVLGTLAYLPPEVVKDGSFSTSVDIYSLGVMGYEMLTRNQPFVGDSLLDTMKEIMVHNPKEPKEINPYVPDQLNKLIMDMIAKEAINRPDARSVLTILADLSQKS
jgi:eukaryotic-like serine/threonine-protein kinase